MGTTALVLVIVGLVVSFGAFMFAGRNMIRGVTGAGSDPEEGFFGMIRGHIGAMVVMALGGLLSSIGVILGVVWLIGKLT